MINNNLGHILHRLATIARNGFQGHPRSMIVILSARVCVTSY